MAKEKIKIEITLKDGVLKPAMFTEKKKVKREIRISDDGCYGIVTIFETAGQRNLFLIKIGLIEKVDIK